MAHKILVAQGGGPTAVINQSLVGVALEARRFPAISPRLRRAARRARHRQRGIRRSRPGDGRQSRGGRRDAGRRARLDPRQARPQILPGDLQGPARARDRHVLLHRRQRFLRHGAHRRRGGDEGRPSAPRHPYPQDDRQRPRRLRPHAGLSLRGAFRRAGLHGRQSRQSRRCRASIAPSSWAATPASSPPPRALARKYPGRRAASDLSARAHVRRSTSSSPT